MDKNKSKAGLNSWLNSASYFLLQLNFKNWTEIWKAFSIQFWIMHIPILEDKTLKYNCLFSYILWFSDVVFAGMWS